MFKWIATKRQQLDYIARLEECSAVLRARILSGITNEEVEKEMELVSFSQKEGFDIRSALTRVLLHGFWDLLKSMDIENYITMDIGPAYGPQGYQGKLNITIGKYGLLTPADHCKENKDLKHEIEVLTARVHELEGHHIESGCCVTEE